MLKKNVRLLLLLVACAGVGSGQTGSGQGAGQTEPAKEPSAPPESYYRIDYVVKEVEDGKAINAREYSVVASTRDATAQSRTGTRIPYRSSPEGMPAQYSYLDLGVNLDSSRLKEVGPRLALYVSADITSVAGELDSKPGTIPPLRTTKWSGYVIIPLKKPTVIFSSDDPGTKRTMQLEITATPIP